MGEPIAEVRPSGGWLERTGAWLIDVVLVVAVVAILGDVLGVGQGLATDGNPLDIWEGGTLLFVYWTLFEGTTGQSPGKVTLNLQVVAADGRPPSLVGSAIQSFGKAFLLPVDVLIGFLAIRGERLRLFHRLSGTRVVGVQRTRPGRRGAMPVDA